MFSHIHPRSGFRDHSLRKIRELVREVLEGVEPYIPGALLARKPTVDPARAAVKRVDFAGVRILVRSERQLMEQLLQPAVSLVRRSLAGRSRSGTRPCPPRTGNAFKEGDVFEKFMTKLLKHEKVKPLLSDLPPLG